MVGRGRAALLNSTSRPFRVIHYWGVGARVFDRARTGPLADRTIGALQRNLAREAGGGPAPRHALPPDRDPYCGYLTLTQVYR